MLLDMYKVVYSIELLAIAVSTSLYTHTASH